MKRAKIYQGYTRKLIRVDLTRGQVGVEEIPNSLLLKYIGGAGLASRMLYDELEPGIEPLSERNKVVFLAGPLAGTIAPTGSRIGAYTKSPLTGSFFHASAGGSFAAELKYAGYDGVMIEGRSRKPVYLFIHNDLIELRDAGHLWGEMTYRSHELLKNDIGDEGAQIAVIGPAGERRVRFANVIVGGRALGRGGIGAVLGSKMFKAIAVRGTRSIAVADIEATLKKTHEILTIMRGNPATGQVLPCFGTPVLVNANNSLGVFGSRNWQREVFEGADGLSAESMRQKIVVRDKACFACPIRCGKYSVVQEGPYKGYTVEGPEYENIFALGSLCENDSIEIVAAAERECDDYGMDAIETGAAIAFIMEARERGILSVEDTDGLNVMFGNRDVILPMIRKIGMREGIGDTLAEGVRRAADIIGKGSHAFAMQNKGLSFPGHSARGLPGFALGYATGPRGASHHDARPTGERTGYVPRDTIAGKPQYIVKINHLNILTDSMILCHLAEAVWGPVEIKQHVVDLLNVVTGMELTLEEANTTAERIWNVIRAFGVREGLRRRDDTLPQRFLEEPIPDGPSQGMVMSKDVLERMKDEYYEIRGWDKATGIPTPDRLMWLDLPDIARDMQALLVRERGER
ncbi:MAG: aldehyde ferredoxin oxidoreductase family protein [Desulfobacterota bacterium]|nr:aldehyde ferredoxin oxidoreductase family protein [Thermodesulfobacteriota bacterium]